MYYYFPLPPLHTYSITPWLQQTKTLKRYKGPRNIISLSLLFYKCWPDVLLWKEKKRISNAGVLEIENKNIHVPWSLKTFRKNDNDI
jgi:SET domain-containing protein